MKRKGIREERASCVLNQRMASFCIREKQSCRKLYSVSFTFLSRGIQRLSSAQRRFVTSSITFIIVHPHLRTHHVSQLPKVPGHVFT